MDFTTSKKLTQSDPYHTYNTVMFLTLKLLVFLPKTEAPCSNGSVDGCDLSAPYGSLWFQVNTASLMPNPKTTQKNNLKSAS